jgi:hypothetical protein
MIRGRPTSKALTQAQDTHPEGEAMPSALMVGQDADMCTLLALSHERDLHMRLRFGAWRDGYRAAAAGLDEARLAAFAHGWAAGLRAGAERGVA